MCTQTLLHSFCAVIVVFALHYICAGQTPPAQSGNASDQTHIFFTVVDKHSHFVDTLQADDLRLLKNDKPQPILRLQKLEAQSLALAVLIDVSASQEKMLPLQKRAADSFVQAIMGSGKAEA